MYGPLPVSVRPPLPVSVRPAVMGYKMIANQMAGLLGHPVKARPAVMGYKMMYHGPELISILTNGTPMFQLPVATQMYARKRFSGLQYAIFVI